MKLNPLLHYTFKLVIPSVIFLHLLVSPYTKVEESFNIQAVHDLLAHGISLQNPAGHIIATYDHINFPGSVPRSFVGAVILACFSKPFVVFARDPQQIQVIVRGILGLANVAALLALEQAVEQAFGVSAGYWYILLQASQFHVMYYASRTLPNMLAFCFSTLALRSLMLSRFGNRSKRSNRIRQCLFLLTFAGVVFRSELAILVATVTAHSKLAQNVPLRTVIIPVGVKAAVLALAVTVVIDSFFWQRFPTWPEWIAFRYNTLEGRSSEWGTNLWHFYFTDSLPRLMMNPFLLLACIPSAIWAKPTYQVCLDVLAPLLSYVAIYSFLPHKEWRFVIYAIPGLTAIAAAGASHLWSRRSKSLLSFVMASSLALSVFLSITASMGFLAISSLSYPGAHALDRLHDVTGDTTLNATVHMDNLSCQTGVTRFLQKRAIEHFAGLDTYPWVYDKTEDEVQLKDPRFWRQFDFALVEHEEQALGELETIELIEAYSGMSLREGGNFFSRIIPQFAKPLKMAVSPAVAYVEKFENWMQAHITNDLWPRVKLRPRIAIMKKASR